MARKCGETADGTPKYLQKITLASGKTRLVCKPKEKKGYDPQKHSRLNPSEGEKRTGTDSSGAKIKMVFNDGKWQRA